MPRAQARGVTPWGLCARERKDIRAEAQPQDVDANTREVGLQASILDPTTSSPSTADTEVEKDPWEDNDVWEAKKRSLADAPRACSRDGMVLLRLRRMAHCSAVLEAFATADEPKDARDMVKVGGL